MKTIYNFLTVRPLRKSLKRTLRSSANKKMALDIQKEFKDNTVLIFQHQFFDATGTKCFNGGAERYVQDLATILSKSGYSPILIQQGSRQTGLWKKQVGDLLVIGAPVKSGDCYLQLAASFTKFKLAIYSGAYHWGKKLLHPNVMISHGITWDTPEKNVQCSKILSILNDVDSFVSVDTNTISWFRSTFSKSISNKTLTYIPNYVDTSIFKPVKKADNGRIKVCFPRRASSERGYWLISRVLPSILDKYSNVDFDFVGFAHGAKISNDIERLLKLYPGRVTHKVVTPDEMVSVYQQSDISLIPTLYSEGTSLSCLEAQACGNVVISTNVGGLSNLVIDQYNGLLINPNANELLAALDTVISNAELFNYLANNAVKVSSAFDKNIWDKKWSALFEAIIPINT